MREQVALYETATLFTEEIELIIGFNTLGHNIQSHTFCQCDYRFNNRDIIFIARNASNKFLIDF